jgi:hypothetical protein
MHVVWNSVMRCSRVSRSSFEHSYLVKEKNRQIENKSRHAQKNGTSTRNPGDKIQPCRPDGLFSNRSGDELLLQQVSELYSL